MATSYEQIFRPWQVRSKEYVFFWNSLVALHSYHRMMAYLAHPPPINVLPSFVFGKCWVSHLGVSETKRSVDRLHQELITEHRDWDYGLWSMCLLFLTFERLRMFPLLQDRNGEPARWYRLSNAEETRTSIEKQSLKLSVAWDVQRDVSSKYGVSLVWDSRYLDRGCTLEQMAQLSF